MCGKSVLFSLRIMTCFNLENNSLVQLEGGIFMLVLLISFTDIKMFILSFQEEVFVWVLNDVQYSIAG